MIEIGYAYMFVGHLMRERADGTRLPDFHEELSRHHGGDRAALTSDGRVEAAAARSAFSRTDAGRMDRRYEGARKLASRWSRANEPPGGNVR